jgi:menaquinol-cytochrome c reductase iron-sulfur subunit
MPRRSFFGVLMAAGSAWLGAIHAIPIVRLALFPLRSQGGDADWSDLGPIENFQALSAPVTQPFTLTRRDGWQLVTAQQTVYVLPASPGTSASQAPPRVLSSICAHLGCTVQWRAEQDKFVCPCHGGTYAADGARISGPPARGMDELPARIENGRLLVQFQTFRQLLATKEVAE